MDKFLTSIETALRKGQKALEARQFTIAFIYLEAVRLVAELVREESPYPDVKQKMDASIRSARDLQSQFRGDLLAHEDRMLLQLCFDNYLFVWGRANQQLPLRHMVIADSKGYWIPNPNFRGEHTYLGETRAEAMKALQELYESLPAKYRSLPLNPMEE